MDKSELNSELEFVREQIKIFKERADKLEDGNWMKNIRNDFDKATIWSAYEKIVSQLGYLLRTSYDAER